jgi:hypothetical protein
MAPCLTEAEWEAALPSAIADGFCLRNRQYVLRKFYQALLKPYQTPVESFLKSLRVN